MTVELPDRPFGRYRLPAARDDERAWLDAQPLTGRCRFCGATREGTAADVLEWQRHHRATHPQAKPARRRRRR